MSRIFDSKTNCGIDVAKPPLGPPLRIVREGSIFGLFDGETEESVRETELWHEYVEEYEKEFAQRKQVRS